MQLKQDNSMELKIISDVENPLFNRREIEAEIDTDVTPNKVDVTKLISEKTKSPVENIKIRTIQGKFGSKIFIIVANIYKSVQDKENTEQKTKQEKELEKNTIEEAKVEQATEKESEPIPEQQEKPKEPEERKEERVEQKPEQNQENKDESKNE